MVWVFACQVAGGWGLGQKHGYPDTAHLGSRGREKQSLLEFFSVKFPNKIALLAIFTLLSNGKMSSF